MLLYIYCINSYLINNDEKWLLWIYACDSGVDDKVFSNNIITNTETYKIQQCLYFIFLYGQP